MKGWTDHSKSIVPLISGHREIAKSSKVRTFEFWEIIGRVRMTPNPCQRETASKIRKSSLDGIWSPLTKEAAEQADTVKDNGKYCTKGV